MLELVTQFVQTKNRTEMKRYYLLMLLVCLLGSNALAQTSPTVTYVADNISFEDYHQSWGNEENLSSYQWGPDYTDGNITSYYLASFNQGGNWWESPGRRYFISQANTIYNNQYRISVDNKSNWNISYDGDISYFQFAAAQADTKTRIVYIHHLNAKDQVTILFAGNTVAYLMSDNTNKGTAGENGIQLAKQETLTIADNIIDGILAVKLTNENNVGYPGIRKIDINVYKEEKDPRFDYDPGYEEYDMYDEFTYKRQNNGTYVDDGSTIFNTNNPAGFNLNGETANYITFTKSKISANDRIAVDQSGTWRFNYGLRTPTDNTNDVWSNFSVCNLRVGDRVIVSYMGGPEDLVFSSEGNSETYNGCAAFADKWNDGVFHDGEDQYITGGMPVQIDWQRNEGTISQSHGVERGNQPAEHQLYYTKAYVIAENGHLDFGIKNGPINRLVKIKIYSDHQAMMVDDYIKEDYRYTAHFNISGELQLKEHIMPGGLEIHIGNDNPNQHAIVVASQNDDAHVDPIDGYVSYVNAVDGYKIPGVKKSDNGEYYIPKFDLVPGTIRGTTYQAAMDRLPETGTYYVFKPEAPGTMKLKFKANSMNYYRWDYAGDAVYSSGGWIEQFDRPNEQTLGVTCPYYLVTIAKPTDDNPNPTPTFTKLGDVTNGQFFETQEITLIEGYTYYLYGAWNKDDVFFNTPDNGKYVHGNQGDDSIDESECGNNIEWRPIEFNPDQTRACGVAELLWVDFTPNRSIFPLAKWVPSGTEAVNADNPAPNPDDPTNATKYEYELANVQGYVGAEITVKKMSGNIKSCHPYIWRANPDDQEGKLMIDNIQYVEGKNPGGTILIKISTPDDKVAPLYSLTIAYSAEEDYDKNKTDAGRGHTWDFSTKSLNGLTWDLESYNTSLPSSEGTYSKVFSNTDNGYAVERDLGNYFKNYFGANINNYSSAAEVIASLAKNDEKVNGQYKSLLFEEIDYKDDHGLSRSDWMFNYNLVNDGNLYDPIFVNKYDMEGDNADMVWESEGMVFQTSSGQSGLFNEYGKTVAHSSEETTDPDRFIGIMKGGKFRIPWLMKDDRVIIRMGIGTLNLLDQAKFSIRNAYDAVHKEISESDDYIVGGSHWDGATGDPYYRGCYHFFAKGDGQGGPADMVFEMKEGSLCKIYSIQIYRGDRIITNEIVGETSTDKFLLYSTAADPNEENSQDYVEENRPNWTLQYLGKDQQMANGTGKNSQKNEIVAKTGYYKSTTLALTDNRVDPDDNTSKVESFTYEHQFGEIGTFRVRGKDMEKNMNYVADYGEHNVTVAFQQTMEYPYTWDAMDMIGFSSSDFEEEDKLGPTKPEWFGTDAAWNASYEKSSTDLSLWQNFQGTTYSLHLNSQQQNVEDKKVRDNIFETAKMIDGNQLWANGKVIPESQGLWFYTDDNYQNHGPWRVDDTDGMTMNGFEDWCYKLVVPNVPAGAAVYLRMTESTKQYFGYQFDKGVLSANDVYGPKKVEGTNGTYVFAVKNPNSTKSNLTLKFGGYQLKKLSVSTDPKSVNIKGYASESRDHAIDASLLPYFTDKPMKSYLVSDPDYTGHTITLTDVSESPTYVISENTGYVIYNPDNADDKGEFNPFGDGKGFHLFVPDMHDDEESEGKFADVDTNNDFMIPVLEERTGDAKLMSFSEDGKKTNYVLSYKWYDLKPDGSTTGTQHVGDEMFYRVSREGINLRANSAYLVLDTEALGLKTSQGSIQGSTTGSAKFTFVFTDWNDTPSVPTAIEEVNSAETFDAINGEWYNMNGQKLNGVPATKGLYIVNGKKVLVK